MRPNDATWESSAHSGEGGGDAAYLFFVDGRTMAGAWEVLAGGTGMDEAAAQEGGQRRKEIWNLLISWVVITIRGDRPCTLARILPSIGHHSIQPAYSRQHPPFHPLLNLPSPHLPPPHPRQESLRTLIVKTTTRPVASTTSPTSKLASGELMSRRNSSPPTNGTTIGKKKMIKKREGQ